MEDLMSGNVNPRQVAMMLRNPSQIAEAMQQDVGGMGASPAEIMADTINVLRADTKRLADVHDVDVDVQLMSPERASDLLAGVLEGDGIEIVLLFNELARKRDMVLREALDADEYDEFMDQKVRFMHTDEPDTFDGDDDQEGDVDDEPEG